MRRAILLSVLLLLPLAALDVAAEGRSCSAQPPQGTEVASITISPGGPITMPADEAVNLTATARDSGGSVVNVPIAWTATQGALQNFGGGSARWSPQMMGLQTVTACSGDVEASLEVNVQPGAPMSFEMSVQVENISADQTIELSPMLRDANGNGWIPNIPFADWTLPEGTSIELPNDGTPPILTPGPVGSMTVEAVWDAWTASVSFNVSRGAPVSLLIEHESSIISSDDLIDLCARLTDQRGNRWGVTANWSTHDGLADASLSAFEGECIVFDAGPIGAWTVQAEHMPGLSTGVALEVEAGRLATIRLDALPTEVHIGEPFPLEAMGFDAAGNPVTVEGWNWSVTDGPSTDPILVEDGSAKFVPDTVGQHTLQVMAAGRVGALDVEVLPGIPVAYHIQFPESVAGALVTGTSVEIELFGVDESGNLHPVDIDVANWAIQNGFGTIEAASAGGTGHYLFTADGIGHISIRVLQDGVEGEQILELLSGPLDHLEVLMPAEGDQGTSIDFDIAGFDVSNNPVLIHACAAEVTTDVGEATCDEDGWHLKLDEAGEQVVHARIGGAEGSDFIHVKPTWFGWGDNTEVLIFGSLLIVAVISTVLVVIFRHLGSRIEEEIEAMEEERAEKDGEVPPPPAVHPPGMVAVPPPPLQSYAAPAAAAPVAAAFTPPPVQPAGWVAHTPPPQPTPQPGVEATPAPLPEITPLSEILPLEALTESGPEPEPESALESEPDPTPEPLTEEEGWASEPEVEPAPEPDLDPVEDDEWGAMAGDWNDGAETLSTAAAEFARIQHENRRGEGPRDANDAPHRPLPGTAAGSDGWYFDDAGKPVAWRHTEDSGWVQE